VTRKAVVFSLCALGAGFVAPGCSTPSAGNDAGADARSLLAELAKTEHPTSCPHGRPIALRYSLKDIQRAFQRI